MVIVRKMVTEKMERDLKKQIEKGILKPHELIVGESKLSKKYNISTTSIRKAIKKLVKEGYLYCVPRQGTYVSERRAGKHKQNAPLGIIVPDVSEGFFSGIVKGCEEVIHHEGHNLTLSNSGEDSALEREHLEALIQSGAKGAIVVPVYDDANTDYFLSLQKKEFPIVFVERYFPEMEADYVSFDNFYGAYQATMCLLKSGCRKIAFIGDSAKLSSFEDRFQGYWKAHLDFGVPIDEKLIKTCDYLHKGPRRGDAVINELLEYTVPEGIFFVFSAGIEDTFRALRQKGIGLNGKISYIVCGGSEALRVSNVPRIEIELPTVELGKAAADLLFERLKYMNQNRERNIKKVLLKLKLRTDGIEK